MLADQHESNPSRPVSPAVARDRIATDHAILADLLDGIDGHDLDRPYRVGGGPLGDFCESLHDLLAHVVMWDEIGLAVLAEARAGRRHWSIDPRWQQPEIGRGLNRGGVLAGRELPADLLRARFRVATAALLADLTIPDDQWRRAVPFADGIGSPVLGAVVEEAMTVPGRTAYWHAAIHLGRLDLLEQQ